MSISYEKGFTLIEVLLVVAIMGLLAALILVGVRGGVAKARDGVRVQSMGTFRDGLELYFQDKNLFPFAGGGTSDHDFDYQFRRPDGTCDASVNLSGGRIRYENSVSPDFLLALVPDYIGYGYWADPLHGNDFNSRYNCRYITPCSWPLGYRLNPCPLEDGSPYYFLHCGLEVPNEISMNDGGKNSVLYEIAQPYQWLCVVGLPD